MPHLHQDAGHHRHQHERGKGQQESAVHGEHRGRQHHEERDDRKEIVVAVAPSREQPYHHDEKHEVHRGRHEQTRKHEIIREIESHVA